MKSIVTIIAMIIALIGYIPYIRDCIRGKNKPHVISWFIWVLVSFIAFGIQLLNKGGIGSFINLFMGVICVTIFFFGLKNGTKNITRVDWVAFSLALIAIVLWLVVKQPLLSIILVVFIDMMSFLPTILKAWKNPYTETVITYGLSGVKNGLSIYALSTYSLTNIIYPVYSLIANFLFVGMLILRKRVFKKKGQVLSLDDILNNYAKWLKEHRIPDNVQEYLLSNVFPKGKNIGTIRFDSPEGIMEMNEEESLPDMFKNKLLIIGSSEDGDFWTINYRGSSPCVVILPFDNMPNHGEPIPDSLMIKVANSLEEFMKLANEGKLREDYYNE